MSKTIDFFREISRIPRESGNEKNIANYLCEFAEQRNLDYKKDEYNNVIIKKKNSDSEPIILQAHIDMVCEKEANMEFDFEKDPIEIIEENGYLRANGTTLGADNGIGVAQILNILDNEDIECNIEAVFTVEEETTMIGAEKIDVSSLKAKKMINLDGFEENTITIGSASFFDIILNCNYNFEDIKSDGINVYRVSLQGLLGGHSGVDIDKSRGNSSIILAELLRKINDIRLVDFVGGTKFNVIPSTAECVFASRIEIDEINGIINNFVRDVRDTYSSIEIVVQKINFDKEIQVLNNVISKEFVESILNFRHGVFKKNARDEVITSINLGVVDLKNQIIKIGMRSSSKVEEKNCLDYIKQFGIESGFEFVILGSQPGFETDEKSELITKLKNAFVRAEQDDKLDIKSVHITVETGFFKDKIEGLDVAIISPKILGAHTTKECVSIKSIEKCDRWLIEFLLS